MIAIAIAGEASVNVETCFSARDCVEDGSSGNGLQDLRQNIERQFAGLESPACPKSDRDSRV
jgi:hypothetical protein